MQRSTEPDDRQCLESYGVHVPETMPHALVLILKDGLEQRGNRGLASPEQVADLLSLGYNPEIVLGLSWAHANETIRLLSRTN